MFKTIFWFNIAGTLKRKKERGKELFLKSHNYLLYFKCPLVLKFIRYVVYLSSYLLLHIIFFSFISLSFILAKCLKSITREFWKFDYSEIYCFFFIEVHAFRYPRG